MMKAIICAIFVVLASSALGEKNEISFVSPTIGRVLMAARENRIYEEEVRAILECFQKVLSAGLPEHGIPSFSPLEIPELKIDLDALGIEGATGYLNFDTLALHGLMDFDPTLIKLGVLTAGGLGLKVELTFMFNSINFKSDYDADLTVAEIAVSGNGDVKLDVTKLQLEVVLMIRLAAPNPSERIYLESMKFLPSVDNVHIEFTGLFDDPEHNELVNELLNSVLTTWVNEKGQDISDLIERIVKEIINNAEPGEPGEPGEDPSIIEIILNECKDETTTTPTAITTPPPINDCEIPAGTQIISCGIVEALEAIRGLIQAAELDPLQVDDFDIDLGTGVIWTLEKLSLARYSHFVLGKVTTSIKTVPGVGIVAKIDIPISWEGMELDITQHGEIEILGMKITADNSKVMGFVRNFNFHLSVSLLVEMGPPISIKGLHTLGLIPQIGEHDIKAICSGIFINGEDVSDMLTNFINNDLAKFLSVHGEDVGDIIAAIIMKIIQNRPPVAQNPFEAQVIEIYERAVTSIQQNLKNIDL